ncbi:MAG: hypothetical protein J5I93_17385 [Pirellulaceae bacterium]|nr:hypothetical protein [Pirellulaceae bacterium]
MVRLQPASNLAFLVGRRQDLILMLLLLAAMLACTKRLAVYWRKPPSAPGVKAATHAEPVVPGLRPTG